MLDLKSVARALGGEVVAGQVLAPGPGHSVKDRSMTVQLNPNAANGFVVFSYATDDFRECRDHVTRLLSLDPDAWRKHRLRHELSPPSGPKTRPAPEASTKAQPARAKPPPPKDAAFVKQLIADIVGELVPIRGGTPGEKYLALIRKIDTDAIADVLGRVDAIGWHPSVLFREAGHPLDGKRFGCILAIMTDPVSAMPTGAISRTYLTPNLIKIGPAKTLGSPAGIVRLSPDDEVLEGLHLAEGLETALAAMAKGFRPMWSAGSTTLMASFPVLAGIDCLSICADNDEGGAGLRAANEAAGRWLEAGRETHVHQRETYGDFNDAFREMER